MHVDAQHGTHTQPGPTRTVSALCSLGSSAPDLGVANKQGPAQPDKRHCPDSSASDLMPAEALHLMASPLPSEGVPRSQQRKQRCPDS